MNFLSLKCSISFFFHLFFFFRFDTGGRIKLLASHKVDVKVVDSLHAVFSLVDNYSVTVWEALFSGNFWSN
jgi:hypothetical protein